jgi:hypothetical protein
MLRSLHQQRPQIGIAFFADVHLRLVKLGVANSRMKDFYDLWVLAQRFQFESRTLAEAIQAIQDAAHDSAEIVAASIADRFL